MVRSVILVNPISPNGVTGILHVKLHTIFLKTTLSFVKSFLLFWQGPNQYSVIFIND